MSKNPCYNRLINSGRWQLLRAQKMKADPICEVCRRNGRTRPATEVHHIVPVESGVTEERMERLAYDYGNLMSLCHECHRSIHEQTGARRNAATAAALSDFVKNFLGGG